MEQGVVMDQCVAALYQSLGLSLGGSLSPQDVCVLFYKVFHLHADLDDAHTAIKVTGNDQGCSCSEGNVLDVLLQMEREKERREEIYWDLQFIKTEKLRHLYHTNRTGKQTKDRNSTDLDQGLYHTTGYREDVTNNLPSQKVKKTEKERVFEWRLRKAARQCWARLLQEGVCAALPSLRGVQRSGVRCQPLGCVSMSDLLLLVEVKYDAVMHTLYTEMLQEHHGLAIWETLLQWERELMEAELGIMWEETCESGDMLSLCELPGAFRIYSDLTDRCSDSVSLRGCPERVKPGEQLWSAISLLTEIHTSLDHEKTTLSSLEKRLDRKTLQLMGLYASLATIRAQRETVSHSALLAARQDWGKWPCMEGSESKRLARLWLQKEEDNEEEEVKDEPPVSPQQMVLRCLVLNQWRESRRLLRMLHRVSPDELQGPAEHESPTEEHSQRSEASLREGCIRRLRHTHTVLQLQSCHQTQPVQGSTPPQVQSQWGNCALALLVELMELHDAQAAAVLPALLEMSEERLLALRMEYESEIREPHLFCLFTLLAPNLCLNSDPCLRPSELNPVQNRSSAVPPPDLSSGEPKDQRTNYLCTDCGTTLVPEDLPYLEILCVSDILNTQNECDIGDIPDVRQSSPRKTPQSFEKQDSIITLAWSKPPEGDTEQNAEITVDMSPGEQEVSVQETGGLCDKDTSSVFTHYDTPERIHYSDTAGNRPCEETATDQLEVLDMPLFQSNTAVQQLSLPGDQYLTTGQEPVLEQSEKIHSDLAEDTSEDTTVTVLIPTWKHGGQQESHNEEATAVGNNWSACYDIHPGSVRGETDKVTEHWALGGPDPSTSDQEAQKTPHTTLAEETTVGRVMERERTLVSISVMEREKTIRSLVDLQKKMERKQNRDRERQLMRVQERLSIIQNRKSQEDLMGLRQTDRLRHLTHDLPSEDKSQKTVVRERLEQMKRERSYVMQSKRNRNTAGFKELLGPVGLHSAETDDPSDCNDLQTV
ncbi:hypothetical protein DPEC_G00165970 [Dallia pectoralis]|uniref:Uncharacterized protein n=1 Tax=Dallia pectoralis TaxID=75939 RepID=A0ACC2GI11_DALPE|nr:hypothetical protein DPEC_G00165970 [Dallia pectoralis]